MVQQDAPLVAHAISGATLLGWLAVAGLAAGFLYVEEWLHRRISQPSHQRHARNLRTRILGRFTK